MFRRNLSTYVGLWAGIDIRGPTPTPTLTPTPIATPTPIPAGVITGRIWLVDRDEPVHTNVILYQVDDVDPSVDEAVEQTETDEDGYYSFSSRNQAHIALVIPTWLYQICVKT